MDEKRKPILHVINPRFPLFLALVVLASALGFALLQVSALYAGLAFGAAAILVVFALLHCGTVTARLIFATVAILFVSAAGVTSTERINAYNAAPTFYDTAVVVATIDNAPVATGDGYVFHATELVLNGDKIKFSADVYVETEESYWSRVTVGQRVSLTNVSLKKVPLVQSGKVAYSVLETPYSITVQEGAATLYDTQGGGVFDRVRYRLINAVRSRFTDTLSGVALALLIGDKSLLPAESYNEFKLSGIAHALAVSGLHVGFLLSVIAFFTRRLGGKGRVVGLAVTAIIVVCYAALCGFTPGVTRACIMGILAQFASVIGKRSDSLHNLSLAAILMLGFDPLLVADLGFALSFASVAGIVLLMPPLHRLCRRLKFPEWLASGVAVTTASSVAVLPLIASYFGSLSLWSVLENLIASPLIAFVFIVLIVCAVIAVATGWFAVLDVAGFALKALRLFTGFCAKLPLADYVVFPLGASIPFFLIAILFAGGLILIRSPKWQRITVTVMSCLLVALIVVSNIAPIVRTDKVCVAGGKSNAVATVATAQGTVVVGRLNSYTASKLESALIEERIRKVDLLIVTSGDLEDAYAVKRFMQRFCVDCVLIDSGEGATDLAVALGKRARVLLDSPVFADGFTVSSALASGNVLIENGTDTYLYAEDALYPNWTADVVLSGTDKHASAGALCVAGATANGEDDTAPNVIVRKGSFVTVR